MPAVRATTRLFSTTPTLHNIALLGWHPNSPVRRQIISNYFKGRRIVHHATFADVTVPEYPDIKPAADFEKGALANDAVSAVLIGTVASKSLISQCLDAGKHVLLERPVCHALSAQDVADLYVLAQKKDKILMFPSFKRYSPHYCDALANWTTDDTISLTRKLGMIIRDDVRGASRKDTHSYVRQYMWPDLDFLARCVMPHKMAVTRVAESNKGMEITLKTTSGVEVALSHQVETAKFLYKLLWNDRCVVRVEGLTYYSDSTADYYSEGYLKELVAMYKLIENSEERQHHLSLDSEVVVHSTELSDMIAGFDGKEVLSDVKEASLEEGLRALPGLRSLGIGVHLDKIR